MTNVREILNKKGATVLSVSPQETVKNTLKIMAEKNVGAVLVMENKKIVGVFSERDFSRHCAQKSLCLEEVPVKDLMTTNIIFVTPAHTTEECMSLMTTKRIRHLPVMEADQLIGLISIGDVVKQVFEDQQFFISQLKSYLMGH